MASLKDRIIDLANIIGTAMHDLKTSVDGKVPINGAVNDSLYYRDQGGNVTGYVPQVDPTVYGLALRDGNGQVVLPATPTDVNHATPKNYVDSRGLSASERRVFFPETYGAKGDGTTNDSAAIQSALNSAKANGGIVWFSPKTYLMGAPVIVGSNTTIDGPGATILSRMGSSQPTFVSQSDANAKGYGAGGRNIHFRNIRILGDYTMASPGDITTGWNHIDNLTFFNVTFEQGMVNGHYIDLGGCTNVKVINCNFRGMNPKAGREYIEAVQVDTNTYSASSWKSEPTSAYDGLPSRNVIVTGSTFETVKVGSTTYPTPNPIGSHGAALLDDSGYYQDVKFTGNTVTGWCPTGGNATTAGWLHFRGIRNLTISDNHFIYTGPTFSAATGVLSAVIWVIPVTSAYALDQVAATSPTSTAVTRYSTDVVISGNIFTGFGKGPWADSNDAMIRLSQVTRANVSNNMCDGSPMTFARSDDSQYGQIIFNANQVVMTNAANAGSCFNLSLAAESIISNNHVTDNTGSSTTKTGGIATYRAREVVMTGNVFTNVGIGIWVNSQDNGIISGNAILGFQQYGIAVGDPGNYGTTYDLVVTGNRVHTSTAGLPNLYIGTKSTRLRRYGNLFRDPGVVTDNGTGTTTVATDQTA